MSTKNNAAANALITLDISLEEWLQVLMLTPIGDPCDPDCLWGVPTMIHGPPGCGKSSRVKSVARSLNLPCESVELSGRQPEDAGGAPFQKWNKAREEMEIYVECTLPAINRLNNKGHGILFLDELPNARPATQGAFLAMVDERRVGDTVLSPAIRVIAAGNPPGESAGAFSLSPPMANRFAHRDLGPPTVAEFTQYLMTGGGLPLKDIHTMEGTIKDGWNNVWPGTKGQIGGFINLAPDHIYSLPQVGNVHRGKAFTTPRSIERAARAITTARLMGLDASKQEDLFTSLAGGGTGSAWGEWSNKANLPSPEKVINEGWPVDPLRLDIVNAILTGVVAHTLAQPELQKKRCAVGAWNYITDVARASLLDLAFGAAIPLVNADLGSKASEEIARASREPMERFIKAGLNKFILK